MKKLVLSLSVALLSLMAVAQEEVATEAPQEAQATTTTSRERGPQTGDKSVSLILGKAENFGNLQYVEKNASLYSIYSPNNNTVSSSDNSLVNMIGFEGKYYITNNIAVRLSGMGMMSASPAQDSVPGIALDPVSIPEYADVPSTEVAAYIVNIGGDYYFDTKVKGLFPYMGIQGNVNYAKQTSFTLQADDFGERVAEAYGFGGSAVGGIDYYIADGMYIGFEAKIFSYMYSVAKQFPYPGMEAIDADNHTVSFLSNPVFKVGFTF